MENNLITYCGHPVRVGCGRLGPCEKSNMFDISPNPNRLFYVKPHQICKKKPLNIITLQLKYNRINTVIE